MKSIREYIGTRYNIVGIKFFSDKVEEDEIFKRAKKPMMFCEAVKLSAEKGEAFLFYEEDEACPSAIVALGYEEPEYIEIEPRIKPAEIKAVKIAPYEKLSDADVFLIILTPRQAMELAYMLEGINARFAGNIAICGEAAAFTYTAKKPNISFLCSGARITADFKDNEVVMSLTKKEIEALDSKIKALAKTCSALCGCRTSDIPQRIVNSFKKIGFEKGIDYFFGRVNSMPVRVYLNKDENGRLAYITLHFPLKEKEVNLDKPFFVRKLGKFTHVSIAFNLKELGEVNIYTGRGLKEFIEKIASKVKENAAAKVQV